MQQSKAASAAGLSVSGSVGAPNGGRRNAKTQSSEKEATASARASQSKTTARHGLQPKSKKGNSAAASTQAPAEAKTVGKPNRPQGQRAQQAGQQPSQEDAISLLQRDHRTVEQLFSQYEAAKSTGVKERVAREICMELIIHARLEEEIFYPACRASGVEDDALDEAQVEHDGAKVMIGDLLEGSPDDPYYDAKVKVLKEYIKHHVNEEEKADGIFSKARQANLDMDELGTQIKSMKEDLTAEGEAVAAAPLETPSLQLNNINTIMEETQMPRHSSYDDEDDNRSSRSRGGNRGRDSEGRFMGDDDDGRSSRGRSSRSSDDDEDNGRGRGRSSQGRSNMEHDDQGRFMSEDDEDNGRGRSRSSRSGYDDDDNGRSSRSGGNRGRSNMDRDDQGRFMSDDDEDNGRGHSRSSRSNYDDDDYGRSSRSGGNPGRSNMDRDDQGRFMSDDDDDDNRGGRSRGRSGGGRGHGGWFGDSEGHSRAASQRQQSQSSGDDDDDRGGRSRGRSQGGRSQGGRSQGSRSQSSGSQGHGGWFGDSEGHAQAARRGWRDRD